MASKTIVDSARNQTVWMTGGAQRIGKEVALFLANAGYDIALHYRHSKDEANKTKAQIEAYGRRCVIAPADFNENFDPDALLATLDQTGSPISHLINNASSFHKDTLATISAEQFDHHMHANLLGATLCSAAFIKHVNTQNLTNASITNISDGIEGWSMSAQFLSYALSKKGIENLTELLAIECAPTIRVNTLALGPSLIGEMDGEVVFDNLAAHAPLNRTSAMQEVCDALCFLINAPAITGQKIALNNGMHLNRKFDALS